MPSSRAATRRPRKSVGASGGRSTGSVRSVAMSLNERSSSACSISARRTAGFSRHGAEDHVLEVALAPSSSAAVFAPIALGARQAVGRVAAQRDEVRHLLGVDAVHPRTAVGVHLVRPLLARALEQDGDGVAHALEHVAVAGEHQRVPAGLGLGDAHSECRRSSASRSSSYATVQPNAR